MTARTPRRVPMALLLVLAAGARLAAAAPAAPAQDTPAPAPGIRARLAAEAETLRPLVTTPLARAFLDAVPALPEGRAQTLHRAPDGRWFRDEQLAGLDADTRAALQPVEWSAERFYLTKYGSPLAYTRALELLGRAGVTSLEGRRVLDFGYGGLGHLRLLAALGADVTGVDPDPLLAALYAAPGDTGVIVRQDGPPGQIALVEARWPSTPEARAAVGRGYDVILSKNTLKRGYVHPEREADPRQLIDLGPDVDDAAFVGQLARALRPGGLLLIYNLCPPPAAPHEPYVPWADGRCPFERGLLAEHGLEVLVFDADDGEAARAMGRALGWEGEERPLDETLFATWTLLRRRD